MFRMDDARQLEMVSGAANQRPSIMQIVLSQDFRTATLCSLRHKAAGGVVSAGVSHTALTSCLMRDGRSNTAVHPSPVPSLSFHSILLSLAFYYSFFLS